MNYRQITSNVIYLFLFGGISALFRVVILEIRTGDICPKLLKIPLYYPILSLFTVALISHITNKAKTIYFIVLGIVFIITCTASTLHILGYFKCPLTILKGIPKCYYAVGLTGSLLLLKYLQFKEIEKGLE